MNILLIEYNYFHDEVLIPQIDFLINSKLKYKKVDNIFVFSNIMMLNRKTKAFSIYENFDLLVQIKYVRKFYNKYMKYLNIIYIIKTLIFIKRNNNFTSRSFRHNIF